MQRTQRGETIREVQLTRTGYFWSKATVSILENFDVTSRLLVKTFGRKNVIFADNIRYDKLREFSTYNLFEWPLFIVIATNDRVILNALDFSKEYNLQLRIKTGGHSQVNMNPNFYIDMNSRYYKRIQKLKKNKDPNTSGKFPYTMTVRAAATQGDIYEYLTVQNEKLIRRGKLQEGENLAWGGGTAVSVGNVGVTTGGGSGLIKRSLGLASDSVLAIRIALPPTATEKARFIWTDSTNEPELFWALRGCQASNFGIVTDIVYGLPIVSQNIPFAIGYAEFDNYFVSVLDKYQEITPSLSEQFNIEFSSSYTSYNEGNFTIDEALFGAQEAPPQIYMPGAKPYFTQNPDYLPLIKSLAIYGVYVMKTGESYQDAVTNINTTLQGFPRGTGDNGLIIGQPQTYSTIMGEDNASRYWLPNIYYQIGLLNHTFNSTAIYETMTNAFKNGLKGAMSFDVEGLGGNVDNVASVDSTASYGFRNKKFQAESRFQWLTSDTNEEAVSTVQNAFSKYYIPSNGREDTIFVAFPINNLKNDTQQYYGEQIYERLLQVKNTYDPENVLYFQSGIKRFPSS